MLADLSASMDCLWELNTKVSMLNTLSLATEVAWKLQLALKQRARRGNFSWLSFHHLHGFLSASMGFNNLKLNKITSY